MAIHSIALGKVMSLPGPVVASYATFFVMAGSLYLIVEDGFISAILTVASMFQFLAVVLLALQTLSTKSSAGISVKALALDAAALCCRLSSTLWLQGYLPVDVSGDWIYQTIDVCSLLVIGFILRQVLTIHRESYQAELDNFPVIPAGLTAFALAALLHGDMNQRPLFDTFWMTGLFLSVIAVMPQLWLIVRSGSSSKVAAMTTHYIATMALGRLFSGFFMWAAREDITCQEWITGVNHASSAILAAHFIHLLLLGDFMYYYARAILTQGLTALCFDMESSSTFV